MVRRIVRFVVASVVLVAACGAVCQKTVRFFPDAPSAQAETPAPGLATFVMKANSPLNLASIGTRSTLIRQFAFAAPDLAGAGQKDPTTFLSKYLSTSSPKQRRVDASSSDGGFMARATHAAASIFVVRDDSGKDRVNTSYFLRALTSVAADTASRPYWRRSAGEPLTDFGSTVGNDAGMNLLHEFQPGLQHLMKSHAPKFVARIAERIGHN